VLTLDTLLLGKKGSIDSIHALDDARNMYYKMSCSCRWCHIVPGVVVSTAEEEATEEGMVFCPVLQIAIQPGRGQ